MPQTDFSSCSVLVLGSTGTTYAVRIVGAVPIHCTCPSFSYRQIPCKHMTARTGNLAIGRTRCRRCLSWLSVALLRDASQEEALLCEKCASSC